MDSEIEFFYVIEKTDISWIVDSKSESTTIDKNAFSDRNIISKISKNVKCSFQ